MKLQASIDTFSIVSSELSKLNGEKSPYINSDVRLTNNNKYLYRLNANKKAYKEIFDLSEFEQVYIQIIQEMELVDYHKTRVDFRIDCYQDNYNELLKLNKLIILLLIMRYQIRNKYQSIDPLTLEILTIRIQNNYIECENYNKNIQSNGTDNAKNRLELREKSIRDDESITTLIERWCKRLSKLPTYFEELQITCNTILVNKWYEEKEIKVKSLSEFIRKYQENIFCRQQLIEFYKLLGFKNPSKKADNFKQRNQIEYFSINDVNTYIQIIQISLREFAKR